MNKKISALIVDGKEYTITDENKFVQGRRKKRSIDEFKEKKGEIIPILVIPPDFYEEGAVYGFSNEGNYKEWLIENKLHRNYEREKKMLERAKRDLLSEENERINKEVNEATEKFGKFLKEHNLKANEIEKIDKLREDPYFSGPFHSATLYDMRQYDTSYGLLVLPGGGYPCGRHYKDLRNYNFNDRTSSFKLSCSHKVRFFDAINYGGLMLESYVNNDDLSNFWFWFGWWNNRISSAVVY
ncbi:MAG: hypothetical protein ACFFDF_15480 [Candidatus Odinarchaeota archaeon]